MSASLSYVMPDVEPGDEIFVYIPHGFNTTPLICRAYKVWRREKGSMFDMVEAMMPDGKVTSSLRHINDPALPQNENFRRAGSWDLCALAKKQKALNERVEILEAQIAKLLTDRKECDPEVDLASLTRNQLLNLADEHGIKIHEQPYVTKADLVQKLTEAGVTINGAVGSPA